MGMFSLFKMQGEMCRVDHFDQAGSDFKKLITVSVSKSCLRLKNGLPRKIHGLFTGLSFYVI